MSGERKMRVVKDYRLWTVNRTKKVWTTPRNDSLIPPHMRKQPFHFKHRSKICTWKICGMMSRLNLTNRGGGPGVPEVSNGIAHFQESTYTMDWVRTFERGLEPLRENAGEVVSSYWRKTNDNKTFLVLGTNGHKILFTSYHINMYTCIYYIFFFSHHLHHFHINIYEGFVNVHVFVYDCKLII